tara:strand:- start:8843 stop:10123 length:1281 start_codon:yes stop_codon:yes gene_type:complete
MNFLKGTRDEFQKITDDDSWAKRAEIVQRQMAEVFGAKNLSFLMGSGCSSLRKGDHELGIPTMKFLAEEFQNLLAAKEQDASTNAVLSDKNKSDLLANLGIDLAADDVRGNLESMMALLINAHQFCQASAKDELSASTQALEEAIDGIKEFLLNKCTSGLFSQGDDSVLGLYRRFYQSLSTRSRGLSPPWVFTTNYDLFNERAMDRSGIPYSNGFSGTVERRFNPATYRLALAEQLDIASRRWAAVDGFVHFCKLHGSVNWIEEDSGLFPIRESYEPLDSSKHRVMIYPTPSKQTASFGSPYSDMFREFQRQVVQDQSVLVVMGYSFSDEHINNIIFQGLTSPSFKLIAFMDPQTNGISRELASLGDPRIWFVWGTGEEEGKQAHYFDSIVNHLLPVSVDHDIDQTIETALKTLLSKQQEVKDDEG